MTTSDYLDSRKPITDDEQTGKSYVDSAPRSDAWGQPPASRYQFRVVGNILTGRALMGSYYAVPPSGETSALDQDLAEEFEAWYAASDEALEKFEEGLATEE